MSAIRTAHGIAPGKILYHVIGSPIVTFRNSRRDKPEEHVHKLICTSAPKYWHYMYNERRTDSLFFDSLDQLSNGEWIKSGHSLKDCGIGANYNLNRLFGTYEEAVEFAGQCFIGVFFDKRDQEAYNITKERDHFSF